MSAEPRNLPGAPPPDPWPPGPAEGLGFGQNQPISTLPPVVALVGNEWIPLVQNTPGGTPVTMRAQATQVAQTLPANPNAIPGAFAQNQTLISGPAPTFAWLPIAFNALPLVSSWNGETGPVVMVSADVTAALGFTPYDSANPLNFQTGAQVAAIVAAAVPTSSSAAPLVNGTAAPGVSGQWSRGDHVHPTDTTRAAVTALAGYLPLTGGTVTGGVAFTTGIILNGPANLQIGGGQPGQSLSTNGAGVLSWQGGAGIPEAPTDGQLYGRENATWVVVPSGGGGGISDAPADGTLYARENGAWFHIQHTDIIDWTATLAPYALAVNVPVASTTTPVMDGTGAVGVGTTFARADHQHPSDTSKIGDAPNNGNIYARQNAAWVQFPGVTISATAPTSPVVGQLWWDSVGGQLYVWYNDGSSSQWVATNNGGGPVASTSLPVVDGTASAGSAATYARGDHVHPTDTSRAAVTAIPAASTTTPGMDGTAAIGVGTTWARADHIHPTDTSRAAASAVPAASTTTPIMDGTGSAGSSVAYARGDHVHPSDISRLPLTGGTLTGALTPSTTAGIVGTTAGDSAAAGSIGEVLSSINLTGTLGTTGTTVNLTSLTLTPGDWDLQGEVWFTPSVGGAAIGLWAGLSLASATFPSGVALNTSRSQIILASGTFSLNTAAFALPACRVNITAATTYYFVVQGSFTSGSITVQGKMWARRVR